MPSICGNYNQECKKCFSKTYYERCTHPCALGPKANCTCDQKDTDFCKKTYTKCTTCVENFEKCQCPKYMTLKIDRRQNRKCVFIPCPKGMWRPNPKCNTCKPCHKFCKTCRVAARGTNKDCPVCNKPYCKYGKACVDKKVFRCPKNTFKYPLSNGCFQCQKCPWGWVPDYKTGWCKRCVAPNFIWPWNKCINKCPIKMAMT